MSEIDPNHNPIFLFKNYSIHVEVGLTILRDEVIFMKIHSVIEDDEFPAYSLHITQRHIVLLAFFFSNDPLILDELLLKQPATSQLRVLAYPTFTIYL